MARVICWSAFLSCIAFFATAGAEMSLRLEPENGTSGEVFSGVFFALFGGLVFYGLALVSSPKGGTLRFVYKVMSLALALFIFAPMLLRKPASMRTPIELSTYITGWIAALSSFGVLLIFVLRLKHLGARNA